MLGKSRNLQKNIRKITGTEQRTNRRLKVGGSEDRDRAPVPHLLLDFRHVSVPEMMMGLLLRLHALRLQAFVARSKKPGAVSARATYNSSRLHLLA
jgi:hypothetical protein